MFSTVNSSEDTAYTKKKTGPSKPGPTVVSPVAEATKVGGGCGEDGSACPSPLPIHSGQVAANESIGAHQWGMARVFPPVTPTGFLPFAAGAAGATAAASKTRETQGRGGGTGEEGMGGCVTATPWLPGLEQESSVVTDLAAFGCKDRALSAVGCDAASVPLSAAPVPTDV